jgi:xanthine dehydrogenase YagR molybdenum-binding subunit
MNPVTGQPIDRRDGRLKVTGHAKYAAEFDIDNVAHAVLVESTITSGTITGAAG